MYVHEARARALDPKHRQRRSGHGSSAFPSGALGCLPAGGAWPADIRGTRGSFSRGPQGPGAPGLVSGEPVLGSNCSWGIGAAEDAGCIQRIPVAVLATSADTTYLRALVVRCEDSGRPLSFTESAQRSAYKAVVLGQEMDLDKHNQIRNAFQTEITAFS